MTTDPDASLPVLDFSCMICCAICITLVLPEANCFANYANDCDRGPKGYVATCEDI